MTMIRWPVQRSGSGGYGGSSSKMTTLLWTTVAAASLIVAIFVTDMAQVLTWTTRRMQTQTLSMSSRSVMAKPTQAVDTKNEMDSVEVVAASSTTAATAASTASVGYLPLLPWEAESMNANRSCLVPYETENQTDYPAPLAGCCLGSFSAKGGVQYKPDVCNLTAQVYQRHEEMALEAWSRIPLFRPIYTNTNTSAAAAADKPHQSTPQDSCDACQIMNVLLDNNWTMAFMGDSVTGQSFMGLECELRRRGYIVERQATDWRQANSSTKVYFGLNEVHELHVRRSTETLRSQKTAILRYYLIYRPSHNLSEVDEIRAKNDVLIFDHGLHYGISKLDQFEHTMTRLIRALTRNVSQKSWKLLAWRETSAQHFEGHVGGHYMSDWNRCVPINYTRSSQHNGSHNNDDDIRDEQLYIPRTAIIKRILANAATTKNTNALRILPFWHYTLPLHELHPGYKDCTHFCSTPSFWLYLWRQLRNALDEAAAVAAAAIEHAESEHV